MYGLFINPAEDYFQEAGTLHMLRNAHAQEEAMKMEVYNTPYAGAQFGDSIIYVAM